MNNFLTGTSTVGTFGSATGSLCVYMRWPPYICISLELLCVIWRRVCARAGSQSVPLDTVSVNGSEFLSNCAGINRRDHSNGPGFAGGVILKSTGQCPSAGRI